MSEEADDADAHTPHFVAAADWSGSLRRAARRHPIGPLHVFAMDVPVGRTQHESGSASSGKSGH